MNGGDDATEAEAVLDRYLLTELPTHTIADAAEGAGLSIADVRQLWLASGFRWFDVDDDAPVFTASDVATFSSFAVARDLFGHDASMLFTRAMGLACARMAQAAVELFLVEVAEDLRDAAPADRAAAYELAGISFSTLPPVIERLFRQHAVRAVERWRVQKDSGLPYDVQTLAVGFVDLVGFTESTQDIDPHDLAALVARFETEAHDAVTGNGGEVVKLIGDEVMFVAETAADSCAVAVALFEAFLESGVTPRGGIALGPIVVRSGDFYGPVVNLAARLAAAAAPDEVLVTEAVRAAVGEATSTRLEPAGRRVLKGFAEPVATYSLTR